MTVVKDDAPLVSFQITNPLVYLKNWWNKIIANQAISIKIPPLVAIILVALLTGGISLGALIKSPLGKFLPFSQYLESPQSAQPVPSPWRDAAFTGILQYSQKTAGYYLTTTSSEVIILEVPANVELSKSIGRIILAIGSFNADTKVLKVQDATTMELLPQRPTLIPTNPAIPVASPSVSVSSASSGQQ